jgi:hypothetical protein
MVRFTLEKAIGSIVTVASPRQFLGEVAIVGNARHGGARHLGADGPAVASAEDPPFVADYSRLNLSARWPGPSTGAT